MPTRHRSRSLERARCADGGFFDGEGGIIVEDGEVVGDGVTVGVVGVIHIGNIDNEGTGASRALHLSDKERRRMVVIRR